MQRYRHNPHGLLSTMLADEAGEWVKFEDVQDLIAQRVAWEETRIAVANLRIENDTLRGTGGDTHSAGVTTSDGRVLAYNKQTRTIDTLKSPPVEAVATEPVAWQYRVMHDTKEIWWPWTETTKQHYDELNSEKRARIETRALSVTAPPGDSGALREALAQIRGGSFVGAGDLAIAGNWHAFVDRLQAIADAALKGEPSK